MKKFVIDGDYLEGGGQILRTSLAISAITKSHVKIEKIRYKRKTPGLQNQHLTGVNLLRDICKAKTTGATLQSVVLDFVPNSIEPGKYRADSKTAGSVCLILQAVLPVLIYGKSSSNLCLIGGTDADFAPPVDYFKEIVKFYMVKMNVNFNIDVICRGFFPKGSGEIKVGIEPLDGFVKPITLVDRGEITKISGNCFVAGVLPVSMAEEMKTEILRVLKAHNKYSNVPIDILAYKETKENAFGNGSGCQLIVETSNDCRFGFNIVGRRELSATHMGGEVAKQFIELFEKSACCLDTQMQDQILLFMALANGKSTIRSSQLTKHSETCIHTIEQMMNISFNIERITDSNDVLISCEGAGIENN